MIVDWTDEFDRWLTNFIGDVFYASATARGEAIVDAWLRQKGNSHD